MHISSMRHGRLSISAPLLVELLDVTDLSLRKLKAARRNAP